MNYRVRKLGEIVNMQKGMGQKPLIGVKGRKKGVDKVINVLALRDESGQGI